MTVDERLHAIEYVLREMALLLETMLERERPAERPPGRHLHLVK